MAASDARPVPRKNTAFRATFGILDADGDLVSGAGGLDSEYCIDCVAFTDCSNEATEIGSSGQYYLDLTADEMNGDSVIVQVKTTSTGAKTTTLHLYPEEAGDIRVDVVQISGDATAADNCELMFDGTGYAGGTTKLGVDTVAISGDTTAADNAEAMFDGTGYAGGTIKLGVDAVMLSGDTTAADNAELMFDGTGYAGGTTKLQVDAVLVNSVTPETSADFADAVVTHNAFTTLDGNVDAVLADTADMQPKLGTPAGASMSADIAAVKGDTAAILVDTGTDGVVVAAGSKTGYSLTATTGLGNQTANITGSITTASNVTSVAAGAITSASFATGAIDSTSLGASAVDEILDDTIGDGTITVREALRVILSAVAGKVSGAATTTVTFRNTADSANVIVATVDADGNRSAVTVTP